MIGYFKERSSLQIPALLLVTLALKLGFLSQTGSTTTLPQVGGLLTSWMNSEMIPRLRPSFLHLISLLFLLGSAIYANVLASSRRMFNQRHSLVAVCIILITSLFPGTHKLLPATIILPLFVAIFAYITQLYNTSNVRSTIVNSGMLAGLAYLLYHPFVFVLPACFIGLAFMRPFRFSEWVLMLLGMATPLYFVLAYEYLTNQWHPAMHLPHFIYNGIPKAAGMYWYTAFAMAGIWLLISFSAWQVQTRRMVIQARKNWYILLFMGLFCLPGLMLPAGNTVAMVTLISFPLGTLLANTFAGEGKGVGQLLFFWAIIIAIAFVSWGWMQGNM